MDRVRVETGQETVFGPMPVGTSRVGIGSIVVDAVEAAVVVVALVELAVYDSSDSLSEDAPKYGSSRYEASASP